MENVDVEKLVILIMALAIPATMIVLILRTYRKDKDKIITARIVQLGCIVSIIPTIILLALEKILDGATVGTLLGSLAGFVLSNVGKYQKNEENK